MSELHENSTWKIPRGKHHNKTATKTTVSIYIPKNLLLQARKHKLNISKITSEALTSIINNLEKQTINKSFLDKTSFTKEVLAGPAGIEPATYGLRAST